MTLHLIAEYVTAIAMLIFTLLVSITSTNLIFFTTTKEQAIPRIKTLGLDLALFLMTGGFYLYIAGT